MLRALTKTTAWFIYFGIIALYAFSLWALVGFHENSTFISFSDVLKIISYSLLQATLSASISLLLGCLLARSFFYLEFKGKDLLYKIISFVWALPSLVIIFAVIEVFGNAGWLAQLFQQLGWEWQFNLYGLQGILIAHCLFNIPLVMKYYVNGLKLIPSSQYQLAAQLNLAGWQYIKIVEMPTIKTLLPYLFMTVFLVCFTSFPIVLMLGGSPKYSTLEVAIFQAVTFEFDFAKAIILIAVQFLVGICLQVIMSIISTQSLKQFKQIPNRIDIWKPTPTGFNKYLLQAVIFLQSFTIILPLASVVWSGISVSKLSDRLLNPLLWQAIQFSLLLSLIASVFVVSISYLIALETRQQLHKKAKILHSVLSSVAIYPLLLPIFLLSVGLFILLMNSDTSAVQLLILVGICNGLTLLPFIYPMLFSAMWNSFTSHYKLAQSLNLKGIKGWWIVEKNYLIRPLASTFALAMSSSLGSFTVIAFFGNADFTSLPYLLYQQLGSYRTEDAAVTALVLMFTSLLPFLCIKDKI
ncbi:thiamine/thiamine pyrophosphate ABC transporter permease ThiP [Mannheimia sp. AT1]|uniref:Thiamine/thiamine pyrophosphate ABC transporter permease ThiP n=1 Tax=Mannheimia cairinae TaxID=3025936 RepID=A0ABT5MMH8_9PAST|nr:thiamine/thiamine pyrophosphate ABC transporter permease ThiP [Mannheimia cairinae]MDD0823394.1 thiamine/thiamine pyrophosphate ABC transporter permease ThiP [Mannheimia cairinae]MDD0826998.1 thiamine/thiamine pyrophosphate ABC transporter permease ThiP [Mannheimia cairinae]